MSHALDPSVDLDGQPFVKFRLQCGSKMIQDILNPKPEEMDLAAIEANLKTARRWSNHPLALVVDQHRLAVYKLACMDTSGFIPAEERAQVLEWCLHHDDPEGVTGDIVSPLKGLISTQTDILHRVENGLEKAICAARGMLMPSDNVRAIVHHYDKIAETLEWCGCLGNPLADWNYPLPDWLSPVDGDCLIQWARQQ